QSNLQHGGSGAIIAAPGRVGRSSATSPQHVSIMGRTSPGTTSIVGGHINTRTHAQTGTEPTAAASSSSSFSKLVGDGSGDRKFSPKRALAQEPPGIQQELVPAMFCGNSPTLSSSTPFAFNAASSSSSGHMMFVGSKATA
ncbi:unnamed protein product, partial [Amoebophrya sp. A25]